MRTIRQPSASTINLRYANNLALQDERSHDLRHQVKKIRLAGL